MSGAIGLAKPKCGITITFGDAAENHVGVRTIHPRLMCAACKHGTVSGCGVSQMQRLGERAADGFSYDEVRAMHSAFLAAGETVELFDLGSGGGDTPACVLVLRNPLTNADALLAEQRLLRPDSKAYMKGRVVTKHARHNLCFGAAAQEPDYVLGKGRIIAWSDVPALSALRDSLSERFGAKATGLHGEGNYYFDITRCGIGFHGDSERRRVVGLRLGESFPLHFQWFQRSAPIGERVILELAHGDMYIMSEKAVGFDWGKKVIPTLRHAAGCAKYTTIKS